MASTTFAHNLRIIKRKQSRVLPNFAYSSWAFCHHRSGSFETMERAREKADVDTTLNLLLTPLVANEMPALVFHEHASKEMIIACLGYFICVPSGDNSFEKI